MKTISRIICLFVLITSFSTLAIAQPSTKDLARAINDFAQKEMLAMLPLDLGTMILDSYSYGEDYVQNKFIYKDNDLFKTYKENPAEHQYQVMLELANANMAALKWSRLFYIDSDLDLKYVFYSPDKSESYSFVITVEDIASMLEVETITPEYRRDVLVEYCAPIMSGMSSGNLRMSITNTAVVTTLYTSDFIFSDPDYNKEWDLPYINSEITPADDPGFIFEIMACYLDIDVEYVFVDSSNGQTYKITADRKILQKKVADWLKTKN